MLYKRGTSKKWWFSFTHNGRRIQESREVENRKAAEQIEAGRRVQLAKGEVGLVDRPRFTIEQLLDRLKQRWHLEHKATVQNLSLLKKAKEDWGTKLADDLSASHLEQYAIRRQKQDYSNASTNRVLQCLRRSFTLAGLTWPSFDLLPEENRREGFFSPEQMLKVLAALPDDGLRDYVHFCWTTGMRKGEASSLRWSFIHDGQIVVPAEFCKSRRPHVIPIAGPLVEIVERRKNKRSFETAGTTQLCEYVFHRDGVRIAEFRKSWKTACTKAGCGNMIFHDLRRSAVRDLVRAGVPQSVAMSISGHSTVAVFQRYDIVASDDMKQALEKTAQFRAG